MVLSLKQKHQLLISPNSPLLNPIIPLTLLSKLFHLELDQGILNQQVSRSKPIKIVE